MSWKIVFVSRTAEDEVTALPLDMRSRFAKIADLIIQNGLQRVHEPYVKHVEGKLWEMRLNGADGIARSIYFASSGERVVVLRTFIKKTESTPRREIEIALRRMKEFGK